MTTTDIENDSKLPTIGHNNPPGLIENADLLALRFKGSEEDGRPGQYDPVKNAIRNILNRIGGRIEGIPAIPKKIETDTDDARIAEAMGELRIVKKTVLDHHAVEKAPYLTASRYCDQFFFAERDLIDKTMEILQARGNDYATRKAAEKRRLLRLEAEQAAQREEEARQARLKVEREAEEAAAAAARARKPENIVAHKETAANAQAQAAMLQVDEMIAGDKVEQAATAAMQSTADLLRTRHASGHMSTGKQVGYAEITDLDKLDLNQLRPYLKHSDIEAALKKLALARDYNLTIEGASIGKRDAASYR